MSFKSNKKKQLFKGKNGLDSPVFKLSFGMVLIFGFSSFYQVVTIAQEHPGTARVLTLPGGTLLLIEGDAAQSLFKQMETSAIHVPCGSIFALSNANFLCLRLSSGHQAQYQCRSLLKKDGTFIPDGTACPNPSVIGVSN